MKTKLFRSCFLLVFVVPLANGENSQSNLYHTNDMYKYNSNEFDVESPLMLRYFPMLPSLPKLPSFIPMDLLDHQNQKNSFNRRKIQRSRKKYDRRHRRSLSAERSDFAPEVQQFFGDTPNVKNASNMVNNSTLMIDNMANDLKDISSLFNRLESSLTSEVKDMDDTNMKSISLVDNSTGLVVDVMHNLWNISKLISQFDGGLLNARIANNEMYPNQPSLRGLNQVVDQLKTGPNDMPMVNQEVTTEMDVIDLRSILQNYNSDQQLQFTNIDTPQNQIPGILDQTNMMSPQADTMSTQLVNEGEYMMQPNNPNYSGLSQLGYDFSNVQPH